MYSVFFTLYRAKRDRKNFLKFRRKEWNAYPSPLVIPAQAGNQYAGYAVLASYWIPAFAGMTEDAGMTARFSRSQIAFVNAVGPKAAL